MRYDTKWYNILESSRVNDIDDVLDSGDLLYVEHNEKDKSFKLCVKLSNVISADILFKCMQGLKSFFVDAFGVAHRFSFVWNYNNENVKKEYVEEYFNKIVDINSKKNHSLIALKEYNKSFSENTVNIFVASNDDEALVKEYFDIIVPVFKQLGLNSIEFNIKVKSDEIDYNEVKNKRMEIEEEQAVTRSYEKLVNIVEAKKFEQDKKSIKQRKFNAAIKCEIDELPTTSMQVQEFLQIKGTKNVLVEGKLISKDVTQRKQYNIFTGTITNEKDSIIIKHFLNDYDKEFYTKTLQIGSKISCKGAIDYDNFSNDVVIMCNDITIMGYDSEEMRQDLAPNKRVELHAHTKMSVLDSVLDVSKYVEAAKLFKHKACAVTDHANCHVLPDFFSECKKAGIKPIAGLEGYYIDDSHYKIALTDEDISLNDATFVIFDLETTGFSINYNEIIEIGAIKVYHGMPVDSFSSFVKPKELINNVITELTHITNDDVYNAPKIEEVLPKFLDFIKGCVLVAHNATFDTEFLYENMRRLNLFEKRFPCIDTLQLARSFYSDILKRFNLKEVAKGLKVEVEQQHRALSDAQTTTNIFLKMIGDLYDHKITNYNQINDCINKDDIFKYIIPSHINILVKNKVGLKNLYKIVSDSHTTHFYKEPRVLKSIIEEHREGLLIGSGCSNGEIFKAAYEGSLESLKEKIEYYDYIEVQPLDCYSHIVEQSGNPVTLEYIKESIKLIVKVATEMGKIVVATGDVHQLNKEDVKYRKIFTRQNRPGGGMHDLFRVENIPNMYFRTTQEMLDAFSFLQPQQAYDIVVTNTNLIAEMVENFDLFPKELLAPRDDFMDKYGVPSMKVAIHDISFDTAKSIYGDPLPKYVESRLNAELDRIIGHGYASIYYISHMLVKYSNDHGYIVGSRGSVGSSFVATMMNITEVNPLVPHYNCPHCHFSAFKGIDEELMNDEIRENLHKVNVGFDLEDAECPICGSKLLKDGVSIPFETFLGFPANPKTPDIDLNFSGEFQPRAHKFCQEVFGLDNAFRAGTIGTVASKTAYGYVKSYYEEKNEPIREAEIRRIANALIDAKRTTGQHPGGVVVVPDTVDYTDILPVQYPADDLEAPLRTTHYEYHKFEENLLKLDILGHDDPTVIKRLMDFVNENPSEFPFTNVEGIPFYDTKVLSLFSSKNALNLNGDDNDKINNGTIGIPEFGTGFVRGLLDEIKPKRIEDIIKISGISHGTDVWLNNARDLLFGLSMTNEPIPFEKVIGCRDDIMVDLLSYGLEDFDAFMIMEHVRKGKGLTEAERQLMTSHDVPEWYQLSCQKIKYMFPKAHATAYVIQALRIGWFKVYRPIYYYSAYFSCRAKELDVEVLASGKNAIRNKINELRGKIANKTASNKEIELIDELQIGLEMYLRGYSFKQVDIEKSEASLFVISEDKKSLYLPFDAVDGLGIAAAQSVIDARNERPFASKKDVERRSKLNRTIFNKLLRLGTFDSPPDEEMNSML